MLFTTKCSTLYLCVLAAIFRIVCVWGFSAPNFRRGRLSIAVSTRTQQNLSGQAELKPAKLLLEAARANAQCGGSLEGLTSAVASALADGGTDGVAETVAAWKFSGAASLELAERFALDVLTASDWVQVVTDATGGSPGKCSSCFNAILSQLGLPSPNFPSSRSIELHGNTEHNDDDGDSKELQTSCGFGSFRYVDRSRGKVAMSLLSLMGDDGLCAPDVVAFSAAACCCFAAGDSRSAARVLEQATKASSSSSSSSSPGSGVGKTRNRQKVRLRNRRAQVPQSLKSRDGDDQQGHGQPGVDGDLGEPLVLFEDEHVVVVNKPAGMLVHPVPGTSAKELTVVDLLLQGSWERKQLEEEEDEDRHEDDQGTGAVGAAEKNKSKSKNKNSRVKGSAAVAVAVATKKRRQLSTMGASKHTPGTVHRLDKGTSGIMVFAKTNEAHASLVTSFFRRTSHKTYLALVSGVPSPPCTSSPPPLGGDVPQTAAAVAQAGGQEGGGGGGGGKAEEEGEDEVLRGVVRDPLDGRPAVSEWSLLGSSSLKSTPSSTSSEATAAAAARGGGGGAVVSLVKVATLTGRKHQVRRHLSHTLGCPILLDGVYGSDQGGLTKGGGGGGSSDGSRRSRRRSSGSGKVPPAASVVAATATTGGRGVGVMAANSQDLRAFVKKERSSASQVHGVRTAKAKETAETSRGEDKKLGLAEGGASKEEGKMKNGKGKRARRSEDADPFNLKDFFFLHAHSLVLPHPVKPGVQLVLTAPPPQQHWGEVLSLFPNWSVKASSRRQGL